MLRYFISSSKTVVSLLPVDPVKVTAVQAEPGWLDLQASIEKTISLISDAGRNGAQILSFPKVFVPGYPWTDSVLGNVPCVHKYVNNSLVKESAEMERIKKAVKQAGVFVVLGYSERAGGSIYIPQVSHSL